MNIAMVTPWPDDESGIAEYAYDLSAGLINCGESITVFTLTENAAPLSGCKIINTKNPITWDLNHFDIIIYHFGNNIKYHGHMPSLISNNPGIVHLHDLVLQHLYAGISDKQGDWENYFQLLKKYYPKEIYDLIKDYWDSGISFWETDDVLMCPLNDDAINASYGVIVHSKFAAKKIINKNPKKALAIINQVYNLNPYTDALKSNNEFTIGIFGHIQKNKCIIEIIEALGDINDLNKNIKLKLIGTASDQEYLSTITEKMQKLSVNISCELTGFITEDKFNQELNNVDLCLALRNPTMGETSAIVTKAIQIGIPVIVSDHGWYSELPIFIPKVTVSRNMRKDLACELKKIINNDLYYKSITENIKHFSQSQYNFKLIITQYQYVIYEINHFRKTPLVDIDDIICDELSESFTDLHIDNPVRDKDIRYSIYNKLKIML